MTGETTPRLPCMVLSEAKAAFGFVVQGRKMLGADEETG